MSVEVRQHRRIGWLSQIPEHDRFRLTLSCSGSPCFGGRLTRGRLTPGVGSTSGDRALEDDALKSEKTAFMADRGASALSPVRPTRAAPAQRPVRPEAAVRRWWRVAAALGWMVAALPVSGCMEPNPIVTSMDNFFDSLGAPPQQTNSSGIITGPGYAPAYPPFDFRSERSASLHPTPLRSTSLK
jgi:hypothetical protein